MSSSDRELIMFFDTETTGLSDFKAPYNAPQQPNLVQLGYKVCDPKTRETIFEKGLLVNTTIHATYSMSPDAERVHGISTEAVQKWGYTPSAAMAEFLFWLNLSKLLVAHNKQYDIMIMQCFAFRFGFSPALFEDISTYCTMLTSTNICKIPSANGRGYKWPKLNEAFPHFMDGQQFSGAHNALVDVNACSDIFWKHIDMGIANV